jgi:hypothetical protein
MREKDIKRQELKQLKKNFPNWRKLKRKEKKRIASEVHTSVLAENSGTKQAAMVPVHELTETPIPLEVTIKLTDTEAFIESRMRNLLLFPVRQWPKQFEDLEPRAIGKLIDDPVINALLAPQGYTPSMRELHFGDDLPAKLLKSFRYAEFSYRKYCKDAVNPLKNKTERIYISLPLRLVLIT